MKWLQLKNDVLTLKAITTIVRDWIKGNQHEIDLDKLDGTLKNMEHQPGQGYAPSFLLR